MLFFKTGGVKVETITNIYELVENKKRMSMNKNYKYGFVFIVLTAWLTFGLNIREKNDMRPLMLITSLCMIFLIYQICKIQVINEMDIKEISSKDMEFIMEIRKESDKYNINKKRYWYIFLLLFFTIIINSKILFIPIMIFPILIIIYLNNKIEKKLSVIINKYDYNNIEEDIKELKIKNKEEFFTKYNIGKEKLDIFIRMRINSWKIKKTLNWVCYKKRAYGLSRSPIVIGEIVLRYLILSGIAIILGKCIEEMKKLKDIVNIGIENIIISLMVIVIGALIITFLFEVLIDKLETFEIRIDNSNIYFIKTLFGEDISFYKKKDIKECFIKVIKRKARLGYTYYYIVNINVNDKIIHINTFRIKEEAEFIKSIIENSSEFIYE